MGTSPPGATVVGSSAGGGKKARVRIVALAKRHKARREKRIRFVFFMAYPL